jgi:hypothetical protein
MLKKIFLCLLFLKTTTVFALDVPQAAALTFPLLSGELKFSASSIVTFPTSRERNSEDKVFLLSLKMRKVIVPSYLYLKKLPQNRVTWQHSLSFISLEYKSFYREWFKENLPIPPSLLEILPPEILINILGHLSPKDLGFLRGTNHYLNSLCQDRWVWQHYTSLNSTEYNSFYKEWFEENLDQPSFLRVKNSKLEAMRTINYRWQTGHLLSRYFQEMPPFVLVPLMAKLARNKTSKDMLRMIAIHEPGLFTTQESVKTLFAILFHADKFFPSHLSLCDQQFLLNKLTPVGADYVCRLAKLIPLTAKIFFNVPQKGEPLKDGPNSVAPFCKIHAYASYTQLVHLTLMIAQAQQFFIPGLKGEKREKLILLLSPFYVKQLIEISRHVDKVFILPENNERQELILQALSPLTAEDQIRCNCRKRTVDPD